MSKEYKNLNIKRENIINEINKFCSINFNEFIVNKSFEPKGGTRKRISINADAKCFYIDFHFNGNGSTTIEDFGGKEVEIKRKLAYFIKNESNCKMEDDSKNKWFVVRDLEKGDFESILELIEESEWYKETIGCKNYIDKKLYKYKGKYSENLTIEYYKTETVVMKGRPLLLFNEVMVMLTQLVDLEDIPKTFNDYYKIEIKKDDIETQYEINLSNSYDKHPIKLKKVLLQAIYNNNLEGDMFEYTFLPFPALRALEGHLKYIVSNYSIELEKGIIGSIFKGQNYGLSQECKTKIVDTKKIKYLEDAYKHYRNHRHSLSHWADFDTPLDTTRIIESISEAKQLIIDTLLLIDKYYIL